MSLHSARPQAHTRIKKIKNNYESYDELNNR
jgi:hypothetical protein